LKPFVFPTFQAKLGLNGYIFIFYQKFTAKSNPFPLGGILKGFGYDCPFIGGAV
jgi:hypothetical protein